MQSRASRVTAVLVGIARGSSRALDLLTQHLDENRPAGRRWALIAMENALPDTLATSRLTSVRAKLTHDDTRDAVQKALDRLSHRTTHE